MNNQKKTSIRIHDALLKEARSLAAREGTTLRALVEEGLRLALAARANRPAFRLRKASFKGSGLQPGVAEGSWERVRDLIYEGRGG